MMNITKNLLIIRCCFIFLVLIIFPQTCCCMQNPQNCSPSACGDVRNISFPFRLKTDPKQCGYYLFELECEKNVTTFLKLNSQKYKVRGINYVKRAIWLADVSVISGNTCSFPNNSLNDYFIGGSYYLARYSRSISLMRCPYQLNNSSLFTELPTHCAPPYSYVRVARMSASDITYNCSVELIMQTSWNFTNLSNVSVSEIHSSLLYGFEVNWLWDYRCRMCNGVKECGDLTRCRSNVGETLKAVWDDVKFRYGHDPTPSIFLTLLVIIVIVFAGVTLPAKIILGFIFASALTIIEWNQRIDYLDIYWPAEHLHVMIGLFCAVRFTIVFPCILWFFIYKFRRRHLSRFAAIENFLQSENNLMPLRYSYSDTKKMTRGFREKLGQGGYGTVYKGKLRSGYDVAVKILKKPKKPGENGQDFMNEIGTIGRIHHVNVVKLVGYCAERSKRALVFDFMPNGSLDKYLYGRENTSCLSWKRKYEIAVGVARGIEYLHRGCDIQILHFDIKPHNILLDDNFTPKITDFGLAKLFSTDKNVVTMTAIRGTIGYIAPELINRGFGEVSYKADVYSFGMLLMEMVGLNKDLNRSDRASSQYFPCWIYDCFEQGHDIEFGATDENDDDDTNGEIARKMTIVALWCIQTSPSDRPSMNKVVEMLEGQVERLRVPNRPPESAQVVVYDEDQSWTTYSTDTTSLLPRDAAPSVEITIED